MSETTDLTTRILQAIESGHTQRWIIRLYSEGLSQQELPLHDWARINAAIKARWKSPKSLVRIKTRAWGLFESRVESPAHPAHGGER